MLLIVLFLILFILLVGNYYLSDNDLFSPAVLFNFSFLFSVSWAILYSKKWDFIIHWNTFIVILSGVIAFSLGSLTIKIIMKTFGNEKLDIRNSVSNSKISNVTMAFIIVFQLFSYVYILKNILNLVGGSWISLSKSIYVYRLASVTDNPFVLTSLSGFLMIINLSFGFWFGYLFVESYVCKSCFNVSYLIAIIIAIMVDSATGSRTSAVNTVIAMLFYFSYFSKKKNKNRGINGGLLLKYFTFFVILILAFQSFGLLLGRQVNDNVGFFDYLAEYCGAEIKNLDTFLQLKHSTPLIFGSQTFYFFINQNLSLFNIQRYTLDLPFQSVNGYSLGNVYTTFYAFVYDFGYIGVPILSGIMGFISQFILELAKKQRDVSFPNIFTILYGYVTPLLVLSFFSNKFYETIVSVSFLRTLICLIMFNIIYVLTRKQ